MGAKSFPVFPLVVSPRMRESIPISIGKQLFHEFYQTYVFGGIKYGKFFSLTQCERKRTLKCKRRVRNSGNESRGKRKHEIARRTDKEERN